MSLCVFCFLFLASAADNAVPKLGAPIWMPWPHRFVLLRTQGRRDTMVKETISNPNGFVFAKSHS